MRPKQEPMPEKPGQILLKAVEVHRCEVGVGTLARILKGSKSQLVFDRQFYSSPFFGALLYHPIDVIENFAKQLLRQGYLKAVNLGTTYPVPVLELTLQGEEALKTNQEIPLQTVRTVEQPKLNESVEATLNLYRRFKNIAQVAENRALAESTIWDHLHTSIRIGLLKPEEVVQPDRIRLILNVQKQLKTRKLKKLKEALPAEVTYEEIKCTLSASLLET